MTEYFIDGPHHYMVKCKTDGKWYRTEKWKTALWVRFQNGDIECINISNIEKTGMLVERPSNMPPFAPDLGDFACAFSAASLGKRTVSCQSFFTSEDEVHAVAKRKLIAALDDTGLWELIFIGDRRILENPEVAAEIVRRKKAWEEDKLSPTQLMIDDLLQNTSFAWEPMTHFAEYLIKNGNAQISEIMNAWLQKVQG